MIYHTRVYYVKCSTLPPSLTGEAAPGARPRVPRAGAIALRGRPAAADGGPFRASPDVRRAVTDGIGSPDPNPKR